METKFQTSFIPKKPIAPIPGTHIQSAHRAPTSIFMIFAVILFLASIGSIGGAYAWKQVLLKTQESQRIELDKREKEFNIEDIERLKRANIRIDTARQLLSQHLALSQIFDVISRLTSQSTRFLSLDLVAPANPGEDIKLTMSGYGSNLPAVAFQSKVLNELENYGLRKVVKNPILGNPNFDTAGTVSFSFNAAIDPGVLLYEKVVDGSAESQTQ